MSKWEPLNTLALSPDEQVLLEAAAIIDKGFARRYLRAAADFSSTLNIRDWVKDPKVGDDLWVEVDGEVKNESESFPCKWQIAVAAAVIDQYGQPDSTFRRFERISNVNIFGYAVRVPLGTTINIGGQLLPRIRFVLGRMPSYGVDIWVELFANHDDGAPWTWDVWVPAS